MVVSDGALRHVHVVVIRCCLDTGPRRDVFSLVLMVGFSASSSCSADTCCLPNLTGRRWNVAFLKELQAYELFFIDVPFEEQLLNLCALSHKRVILYLFHLPLNFYYRLSFCSYRQCCEPLTLVILPRGRRRHL